MPETASPEYLCRFYDSHFDPAKAPARRVGQALARRLRLDSGRVGSGPVVEIADLEMEMGSIKQSFGPGLKRGMGLNSNPFVRCS